MVRGPFSVAMPATLMYRQCVPAPRPATPADMTGFSGRHAPESVADMSGIRTESPCGTAVSVLSMPTEVRVCAGLTATTET